jgi:hypothetical protein
MTEPQNPDLGEPTDIALDPSEVEEHAEQQDATPTSSASRFDEGDTKGGTGGLDAGGAG